MNGIGIMERRTMYIARFVIRPKPLYQFANNTGVLRHVWGTEDRSDMGYILHAAFAACFGPDSPKPFYTLTSQETRAISTTAYPVERQFVVLAYTDVEPEALQAQAIAADKRAADIIDWSLTEFKAMPSDFPEGRRLAFATRVCPVVRTFALRDTNVHAGTMSSAGGEAGGTAWTERDSSGDGRATGKNRSPEVDAYIAACNLAQHQSAEKPARFDVYREWLLARVADSGIRVESLEITGFQLNHVTRRNRDRKLTPSQRPVAEFKGILSVTDPERFRETLYRGIGRHRSFGFGMIRLAPAPVSTH